MPTPSNLSTVTAADYDRVCMSRPPIRGLVRAKKSAYVAEHRVRYLSRSAEEALFEGAEVLSEGCARGVLGVDRRYYGSTMITFDLQHLQRHWRGPLDTQARDLLREMVEGSVRMRLRAMRLACAEVARRVTDRPLGTAIVETTVQLEGDTLQMDVDLEVPVGVSSLARRAP
jgi:hypothetical protein